MVHMRQSILALLILVGCGPGAYSPGVLEKVPDPVDESSAPVQECQPVRYEPCDCFNQGGWWNTRKQCSYRNTYQAIDEDETDTTTPQENSTWLE